MQRLPHTDVDEVAKRPLLDDLLDGCIPREGHR